MHPRITLQNYWVIVQKGQTKQNMSVVLNFCTSFGRNNVHKNRICKCCVLGYQKQNDLAKSGVSKKWRWLLSGKDTFSGHELGFL